MATLGFSHYNLRAPRELLQRLCTFYCEAVGLTVGYRPPFRSFGFWLYVGGQDVLHLTESGIGGQPTARGDQSFDHAAFRCIDIEACERQLSKLGVCYRRETVPTTGQVQLFFSDPAGNGIEMNFEPARVRSDALT